MFQVGQGVYGKIRFKDGTMPPYPRTYLVVSVTTADISVINVSSTAGKEHKLLFPSNLPLSKFEPPFKKESFVKLDSLVLVPFESTGTLRVLHNGDTLDATELSNILARINM